MKAVWIILGCMFLSSCVSRHKYNTLLEEIRLKEKQNAKLETQIVVWNDKNKVLRDSIDRIK